MSLENIIHSEFLIDPDILYLNHAAVSPWPVRTANAVKQFADENVHLGASRYLDWLKIEADLRKKIKVMLNAPSADDIALLKNTSEALSVVACGIDWRDGDNIVSTDQEFPSNRIVWEAQARHGVEFRQVDVMPPAGPNDEPNDLNYPESALISACDEHTRVMAISSVQYGSGLKLDLAKLGQFCRDNNIYFCVDAIQSIGAHQFDIQAIKADFVMADAHKWMCGPEGIALFYCRSEIRDQLGLNQFGWHMVEDTSDFTRKEWTLAKNARRFECGSPNMLGIHALSASLSLFDEIGMEHVEKLILKNTSYLIDKLNNIDEINILSPTEEHRRAGIVTFKIESKDNTEIYTNLMKNRVICANRLGGIRFSPHFYTGLNIIDRSLDILLRVSR
ncbi:MAG: aminotransferase class V-fold PLP-dependent enzyme [Gammaproteobacteria bacterium]|nr:aminotransferase class V-fold PLP-dependent enzyme [Gammaproteobacteria bacterium]